MSRETNGEWVRCSCHPETCCHADGMVYRPKIEWKLNEKERDRFENSKEWLDTELAINIYTYFKVPVTLSVLGYLENKDGKIKINRYNYYKTSEHNEKFFYNVTYIMKDILEYKSIKRKEALKDFKALL